MAYSDPLLGQRFGPFRIQARLDDGGDDLLYLAAGMSRRVDLLLSARPEADPGDLARCARQAEAAAQIVHPHVAAVVDSGFERGFRWLATEHVDVTSLKRQLEAGRLSVDGAVALAAQITAALRAAHSAGLLHGGLRAEHVGIDAGGQVTVRGLGAPPPGTAPLTGADEIVGTVEYMAPEQILGDPLTPATDLYALGLLLYEMLTGRLPFRATVPAGLVYDQLNEPPVEPSLLHAAVPAALDDLVLRLLAKVPDQRPGSTTQVLAELEAISHRSRLTDVAAPEVADPAQQLQAQERHRHFLPRFVGREAEVSELHRLAGKTTDGVGQVLFVAGEAGIGKTRLLAEVTRTWQAQGRLVVQGSCCFGAPLGPYVPILEAIAQLLSGAQGLAPADRQALAAHFGATAPGVAALMQQSPSPLQVRSILSADFGTGSSQAEQVRFLDVVFDILAAAAARRRLVVILEDMHWSDAGTLQLLRHLSQRLVEAPMLLVVTYRPEDLRRDEASPGLAGVLAAWGQAANSTHLELAPLSPASTSQLVRSLFFDTEFRDGFDDYLYRQSQGNPFIATEVLKLLRSRHVVLNRNGIWQAQADFARTEIPARVEALVRQRIDALTAAERQLLQLAAVAGFRFSATVLEGASGVSRVELLGLLFRLERDHRLLRARGEGFEFSHSMIREVLYTELPGELRREYHRLLAGILAGAAGDLDTGGAELGHHYLAGGQFAAALPYLIRAADEASNVFSWHEAAALHDDVATAAGAAGGGHQTRWAALSRAGQAYGHLADYDAAAERFRRCQQEAAAHGQSLEEARAVYDLGNLELQQGHLDSAGECFADVTARVTAIGSPAAMALHARTLVSHGSTDFEAGRHEQAAARWREAHDMLAGSADETELSNVLNNLAVLATVHGDVDAAWDLYQQALALDRRQPPSGQTVLTYYNMGMLRSDQERWDEALELYDRGLELCRRTRLAVHEPVIHLNRAETLIGRGELEAARRALDSALRGFRRLDDDLGAADTLRLYGRLSRSQETWDESRQFLERSIEINRRYGDTVSLGEALYELGELQRAGGTSDLAIAPLREAERIFARVGARPDLDRVRRALAQLDAL